MERSDWDTTWLLVARVMSMRSSCVRRRIGAVVVDGSNRVVATGYNGPAAGLQQTCGASCPRALYADAQQSYQNCISIHAEANALLFCDRREREGGTIYIEEMPCYDCAKLIANSGVNRVVVRTVKNQEHRQPDQSRRYMENSGLKVEIYEQLRVEGRDL